MSQQASLETLLHGLDYRWVVTGGAGFIGSHIVETLLNLNQHVTIVDNFATGRVENIESVKKSCPNSSSKLTVHNVDIRDNSRLKDLLSDCDYVLHQAALGSVPRSIKDPLTSHDVNVNGFLSVLEGSRTSKVRRVVYASSSSVYGDHPGLPKVESQIGKPLSPYAVTKRTNELYSQAYANTYKMSLVGLRYFNVFGPRQDPNGPYSAVIPRWVKALLANEEVAIYGDGETSRDFCYVKNAVDANIRAALSKHLEPIHAYEFNIAAHRQTTLNQLFHAVRDGIAKSSNNPNIKMMQPKYYDFRAGDIRHSLADISSAKQLIDYNPQYDVTRGLSECVDWYVKDSQTR